MTSSNTAGERALSALTRRRVLQAGLIAGGAVAGTSLLAACGSGGESPVVAPNGNLTGSGRVVISGARDSGLTPFKETIIPLYEKETGIKVDYLEDEWGTLFEKQFNDGQTQAGQYDVYIMNDPWVPQFASAGILADLSAQGIELDSDFIPVMADMGYWPPQSGPRIKGFEDAQPTLVALPFIGDLQTLTYRNDVFVSGPPKTWDEFITTAKPFYDPGKQQYGFTFRGVAGNPIVASWSPLLLSFGGQFFDDNWNPTFNNAEGTAAGEFLVSTLKSISPPGVVEFDADQEAAAVLSGQAAAAIQFSGNAIKIDDPKQTSVPGKLDLATLPRQKQSMGYVGIFIAGVSASAPNMENAIKFTKWYALKETQLALARAGGMPVRRSAFEDAQAQKQNRVLAVSLEQLDVGTQPTPRTPDWTKVEDLLGQQLNRALQRGQLGDALDVAAEQVHSYLRTQGY